MPETSLASHTKSSADGQNVTIKIEKLFNLLLKFLHDSDRCNQNNKFLNSFNLGSAGKQIITRTEIF